MRIHIRPVCPEILGKFPSAYYEVEADSDAMKALICALNQYDGGDVMLDSLTHLIFMVNGKQCKSDTKLSDGDKLIVLRPVYGG